MDEFKGRAAAKLDWVENANQLVWTSDYVIKRKIVLDPKLELQCILSCVKLFVSFEVVKFGLLCICEYWLI